MRLLYIARRAWPATGGIETFMRHVAQGVSETHEVRIRALRIDDGPLTGPSDGPKLPAPFVPFVDGEVRVDPVWLGFGRRMALAPLLLDDFPLVARWALGAGRVHLARLYAAVAASQFVESVRWADVVHIWTDGYPAAAALSAARAGDRPVVISPFMHRGYWGDDPASRAVYRAANRVVVPLDVDTGGYLEMGIAPARIAVSGACSPGVVPYGARDVLKEYGIDGPLVLFLGRRVDYKGLDILLEAGRRLPYAAGITIAVAGPGSLLPTAQFESGARVVDLGHVDEEDRARWLAAASLLCLPSESETFGVVLLEAWSVGTPVLCSDIPVLASLVTASGGGECVSRDPDRLAAAIQALVAEPDRLRRLGEAGHQYWQREGTVERAAEWHASLYETVRDEGVI